MAGLQVVRAQPGLHAVPAESFRVDRIQADERHPVAAQAQVHDEGRDQGQQRELDVDPERRRQRRNGEIAGVVEAE